MPQPEPNTPGEIADWPSLQIVYRTDGERIADLLPPGLSPSAPEVHVSFYQVPIAGEPEYGVVVKVPALYNGTEGYYWIGCGIDQEQAIFVSAELNGQPKYPCRVHYYRLGDKVVARATHQGYTFAEFSGHVGANVTDQVQGEVIEHQWWIKSIRGVGGAEKTWDLAPQVVGVYSKHTPRYRIELDGELVLRDSPWDPIAELLPIREQVTAVLQKNDMDYASRTVSFAGALDPDAFWPHADTIGGSRWPGMGGGPRRRP